jgi:TolB protein
LGIYVHPVTRPDPFASDAGLASIPLEYAADVAHGAVDLIEVACLWSDELGTSDLWYRALNLGVPIAPEAGTDAMTDFGRTMAVGTTRVYVRPDGPFTYERYLAALKAGRSFVTTGPMLDFRVRDARPGDVLPRGGAAPFTLELHTAQPVERVEVLVNGVPAWRGAGVDSAGSRRFAGTVTLPAGGWIAARAVGPATTRWPAMDSYAFAHTAPVWIGRVGSTDAAAARAAARDLLRALDVAERRLVAGYEGTEIPALRAHFAAARRSLEARAGTVPAGRAAR